MKNNNPKKKTKTLRDVYMADKDAREFLAKYPEFNDRFLTQTEVNMPGFNQTEGKYTLTEVDEGRRSYGELMLEALNALPENHNKRPLLEDYYAGMTIKDMQKKYNFKNQHGLRQGVSYAKKVALKNLLNTKNTMKLGEPIAERTLIRKGARRTIYLTPLSDGSDFIWTNDAGEALPLYAQKVLDEDPDLKEWDLIYLD